MVLGLRCILKHHDLMKNIAIILSAFSLFSICSCQKIIQFSEEETAIARELAQYYGGEVSFGKKVFYSSGSDVPEMDFRITLKCEDLKKYYAEPEIPASFCVWQFYTQLPKNEIDAITKYIVEIPFDNKLRVLEYDPMVLQKVFDAKYMLDSVSGYFIKGDYRKMASSCRADLQKEKGLPEFWEFAKKVDAEHGKTKSIEIRGFQYYETRKDSESTFLPYLVEFHVLQRRDSTHNKLSIRIDPFSQDGFITGLNFW